MVLEFDEAFWGSTNWMLLAASDLYESSMGTTYMSLQAVEQRPILIAFAGGQDAIDNEDLSDEEIIQIGSCHHVDNYHPTNMMLHCICTGKHWSKISKLAISNK